MNELLATQITTIHGDHAWISLDELKKAYIRVFGQPKVVQQEIPCVPFYPKPPFEVTCHTPQNVEFAVTRTSATQELTMQEMMNAIAGC